MDLFLDWVKENRSASNHLNRFGRFCPSGRQVKLGDLPARKVIDQNLRDWLGHRKNELKLDAQTRLHHETPVRAAWHRGSKHPSPTPHLPATFRPFAAVERTDVPMRPLTEGDLI